MRLTDAVHATRVLVRSGALHPTRPDRAVRMALAYRHWGTNLGAAFATAGARYAERVAIVDERGTVTFAELDARTDALARGLAHSAIRNGDRVGVLCRNHRYIVEITGALAKLGAHAVYLNTGFSAAQLREVYARERAIALVHDEEFTAAAIEAEITPRFLAWTDGPNPAPQSLDDLAARHATGTRPERPSEAGQTVILTSGTTGTPKGAARDQTASSATAVALLECIPYHARETMVVAAPMFHSWGFGNALVGLLLGNTLVFARQFDAEETLAAIAHHRAQVLAAVPVMVLRILELPESTRRHYDTSSLRLVPLSGSALPGDLAPRFMDAFGDVLYNLYGSTEVGYVTIAAPADLRAAPATAGRPPRGTDVRLLDEHGEPVPAGATGRIFVRSELLFEGYTDGAHKHVIDGFMQTGDTGHLDASGRLFVDGRDDDMIVSGGENVFPGEVEDAIATHPAVRDVAVIGVSDPEWGQRLKAFVVRAPGADLDADAVRDHVKGTLARYKVPRDVEFVEALPRNSTGKVLRRNLG
jgi:fatty-acyl-CoA synthase